MAQLVHPNPQLPFAPSVELASINNLIKVLSQLLTEHARRLNLAVMKDGTETMTGPVKLAQYATGDLPAAADYEGSIVYDSTTNTVKFSNGAAWASL